MLLLEILLHFVETEAKGINFSKSQHHDSQKLIDASAVVEISHQSLFQQSNIRLQVPIRLLKLV